MYSLYDFKRNVILNYFGRVGFADKKTNLGITCGELMTNLLSDEENKIIESAWNFLSDLEKFEYGYTESNVKIVRIVEDAVVDSNIEAFEKRLGKANRRFKYIASLEEKRVIPRNIIEYFGCEFDVDLSELEIFILMVLKILELSPVDNADKKATTKRFKNAVNQFNIYLGEEYFSYLKKNKDSKKKFESAYNSIILPIVDEKLFKKIDESTYVQIMHKIRLLE